MFEKLGFQSCLFALMLGLTIEQLPLPFPLKIALVLPSTLLFFGFQELLHWKDRKKIKFLKEMEKTAEQIFKEMEIDLEDGSFDSEP
jgi:hypothetical protein